MTEEEVDRARDTQIRAIVAQMRQAFAIPVICVGLGTGPREGQSIVWLTSEVPVPGAIRILEQLLQMLKEKAP